MKTPTNAGSANSFGSRTWMILNSPFGLFLLSSVLLSGVVRLYSDRQQRAEKERAREQEVVKLATEFDYRVTQIRYLASHLLSAGLSEPDRVGHAVLIWRVVIGEQAFQPTVPEYKTTHSLALVSRLKLLGISPRGAGDIPDTLSYLENGKDASWHYDAERLRRAVAALTEYRNGVNHEVGELRNSS